ncbi:hypothetical protein ACLB2K_077245 [Fragaria x ananassa]
MWTIEKQWVQIFERQQWVINQAKQQAFLFDQDLSSQLLLAGIPHNPSLALNHQELISEVPFPRTRRVIPFTGTDCCGFDDPVATAHPGQLANGLCAEHCGVNKGFDVGENVLDLPQCPTSNGGCASNGFPQDLQQEDPSVTSPEDEENARVSAAYHDSAIQLARVAGEEVSALSQGHNGDAGRASIAVLQDQREENSGGISPQGQSDAKMENQSVSRGTKDIKRATGSLQNRYSKPKLSGKTILRKGGPSLSELEPKPNNIVTNITSFIPLVQQKQAAAALPAKRDIKVKALEAAEAAKRLAERKDYERKMKKEAMKVERARVEQENMRKLELQRKRKEEERKKNEADMAAKKRQREEEDKKEKQRKRMRVEEGRREQRELEEKSLVEKVKKELKCHASDGRGHKNKESKCNTLHKKVDEEMGHDTLRSISETDPRSLCVSENNARTGTAVNEEYCKGFSNFEHKEEVQGNVDQATEHEKLVVKTSREQSYDISPYKESDDEDEEDDDSIPNNKFIPSWASKNCLALVASCQSVPEPEMIFHPKSFPCISEGASVL